MLPPAALPADSLKVEAAIFHCVGYFQERFYLLVDHHISLGMTFGDILAQSSPYVGKGRAPAKWTKPGLRRRSPGLWTGGRPNPDVAGSPDPGRANSGGTATFPWALSALSCPHRSRGYSLELSHSLPSICFRTRSSYRLYPRWTTDSDCFWLQQSPRQAPSALRDSQCRAGGSGPSA